MTLAARELAFADPSAKSGLVRDPGRASLLARNVSPSPRSFGEPSLLFSTDRRSVGPGRDSAYVTTSDDGSGSSGWTSSGAVQKPSGYVFARAHRPYHEPDGGECTGAPDSRLDEGGWREEPPRLRLAHPPLLNQEGSRRWREEPPRLHLWCIHPSLTKEGSRF